MLVLGMTPRGSYGYYRAIVYSNLGHVDIYSQLLLLAMSQTLSNDLYTLPYLTSSSLSLLLVTSFRFGWASKWPPKNTNLKPGSSLKICGIRGPMLMQKKYSIF